MSAFLLRHRQTRIAPVAIVLCLGGLLLLAAVTSQAGAGGRPFATQTVLFEDHFDAGRSALWNENSGSWTAAGGYYTQSDVWVEAQNWVTSLDCSDCAIAARVRVSPESYSESQERAVGLVLRVQSAGDLYLADLRQLDDTIRIHRRVGGSWTFLTGKSYPIEQNRWYSLRFEADGSRLRFYIDGQLELDTSDTTFTLGSTGLRSSQGHTDFDDVVVTTLDQPATNTPTLTPVVPTGTATNTPTMTSVPTMTATPTVSGWPPAGALFWDDFDNGLKPAWQNSGGNWAVNSGRYEQSANLGEAYSWPGGITCTACDVEATITFPSAGQGGGERSIGLVLRMIDTQNLYLADLRMVSQEVRMWRRVGGNWSPILIQPFTVAYDTSYNFKFTAHGSTLQVYVNGARVLEATDSSLTQGLAGLRTSEAHAVYDNFAIAGSLPPTPVPTPTARPDQIFFDDFSADELASIWETVGQWSVQNGALVQTLLGGYTDILAWPRTVYCADCVVTTRARVEGGDGREFGLVARAQDNGSLYMFDLRQSASEARIWRRLDGIWQPLSIVTYTSEVNRWYELRFEAVGNTLRGYVDGTLAVSAQDSSLGWGMAGPRTGDALARFDWLGIAGSTPPVTPTPTPPAAIDRYPDLDALYIGRSPQYAWNAEKNWPDVGEPVEFTLYLANKGRVAAGPFKVRWETLVQDGQVVPGSVVVQEVAGLAAGTSMTLRYRDSGAGKAWGDGRWRDGPYRVRAVVDVDHAVDEGPFEVNNDLADFTNALTLAFKVEQDVYSVFNSRRTGVVADVPPGNRGNAAFYWWSKPAGTPPYRSGTYSWEDWAQRQVAQLNEYFYRAENKYFGGNRNRLIRIRLGRVDIVPDGSMAGSHNFPYGDWTIDLAWGFDNYAPIYTVLPEFTVTEWSLLHELGHHMNRHHPMLAGGNLSLDGTSLGYYPGDWRCAGSPMQNSDYSDGWCEYTALGFDYEFQPKQGRNVPERLGSQNPGNGLWSLPPTQTYHYWNAFLVTEQANGWPVIPGAARWILYEIPESPSFVVPDQTGVPIPGATIEFFRAKPGGSSQGRSATSLASQPAVTWNTIFTAASSPDGNPGYWRYASPPDISGVTDVSGILRLPHFNILSPDNVSWEYQGWVTLARIRYQGKEAYRVVDVTHANNALRRSPGNPPPIVLDTDLDGQHRPFPLRAIQTPVATNAVTATATPTGTPTATATAIVTPIATPTMTPTTTATPTPAPTATTTPTVTPTDTAPATATPTTTPIMTPTTTATPAPTTTATLTSAPTATASPAPTSTATVAVTSTATPTVTPQFHRVWLPWMGW